MMRFSRMTKFCRTKKLGALGALALTAMLVQACDQPATTVSSTRLYAIDQAGGAKTCNSPSAQPAGGQTTDVAMTVTNDGGWCGLSVTQSGKPYSASVLTARARSMSTRSAIAPASTTRRIVALPAMTASPSSWSPAMPLSG